MKANRWSLINSSSIRDSGHEELQTDVMSFMAILGFCLMAIFAIVQSIPKEPADNRPELETVVTLQNDLKALTDQLLQLKEKTEIEKQTVKQLLKLQQQLSKQLVESVAASVNQLQKHRQQLGDIEQRIGKQQQRLVTINNEIWQGEQTLSRLRKRIKLETRIFNEKEVELARLQEHHRSLIAEIEKTQTEQQPPAQTVNPKETAESEEDKWPDSQQQISEESPIEPPQTDQQLEQDPLEQTADTKPSQQSKSEPEQRGFNLRFESDHALLKLLRQKQIDLFAMTNHNTWNLMAKGERFLLNDSSKPRSYYEMTLSTVPAELVRQVRLQRSVFNPNDLTWGVVLPRHIRSRINQLMNQYDSGILVITDQAQVHREES